MKILLLGKNGQVGWELQRSLAPLGELIALDRHGLNEWTGDLSLPEDVVQTILAMRPDIVVNASAYTVVDLAETDEVTADIVNHIAVQKLRRHVSKLMHYLYITRPIMFFMVMDWCLY
jgi:dTDP-4-dehydrorhamnose reductase